MPYFIERFSHIQHEGATAMLSAEVADPGFRQSERLWLCGMLLTETELSIRNDLFITLARALNRLIGQ